MENIGKEKKGKVFIEGCNDIGNERWKGRKN